MDENKEAHLRPIGAEDESSAKRVRAANGPTECPRPPVVEEPSEDEKRAAALAEEDAEVEEVIERLSQQWFNGHKLATSFCFSEPEELYDPVDNVDDADMVHEEHDILEDTPEMLLRKAQELFRTAGGAGRGVVLFLKPSSA